MRGLRLGLGLEAGRRPFNPSQISGYAWDYDASILVAGAITAWASLVGGAGFTLAGTGTAVASGGPSNLPYVQGNGTADILQKSTGGTYQEYFLVAKYNSSAAGGTIADGSTQNTGRLFKTSATAISLDSIAAGTDNNLQTWAVFHCREDTTTCSLAHDGASFSGASSRGGMTGGVTLFNFGGTGDPAAASIARAIGFTTALSASDGAAVLSYLQGKYGVP